MRSAQESWKMFDRISKRYDRINRILSLGMDQMWRRFCAKQLPSIPNLRLLDIASGTGDQLISCMESHPSIQSAFGIDLADEMLHLAKHKISKKPYQNKVVFANGDGENLPFPNESFDAVTCSFGIRNMPNPLNALKQIRRVLGTNGRCLILEFSLPPHPCKIPYLFYLRYVLPKIGGILSKNPEAYRYLNQTIETFPHGENFCSLMRQAGLVSVYTVPMACGAVTLYVGEAP